MQPGHGLVQAWLGATPSRVAAGVDVEARVTRALSAYASGDALWSGASSPVYKAAAGLRLRW